MPRRKLTKDELKKNGTYRADRHESRADGTWVSGSPVKPDGLSDYQKEVWDCIVDSLPNCTIGRIDTPVLVGLMRWIEIAETSREAIESFDPVADVDERARAVRTYALCWRQAEKIMSDFGVTPRNRDLIKVAAEKEETFSAIDFMQGSVN